MKEDWGSDWRSPEMVELDEKLDRLIGLYVRARTVLVKKQKRRPYFDFPRPGDPDWMRQPTELDLVALRSEIAAVTGFVSFDDNDEEPNTKMLDSYIEAIADGRGEEWLDRLAITGGDDR